MNREALARLVREYLLCGHLIDRAGAPLLIGPYGRDAMRDVAIEEWRGASPIYARRIQSLLGFARGDVETVVGHGQLAPVVLHRAAGHLHQQLGLVRAQPPHVDAVEVRRQLGICQDALV